MRVGPRASMAWLCLAGLVVLTVTDAGQPDRAGAAPNSVTGRVYQDFNSDGTYDTTLQIGVATDIGVAGVEVRAFDSTGMEVGSTTTGADGTYTLTITGASGTEVRVEFEIPTVTAALSAYRPSFASTTGASGSTFGTTVQFATVGDTGVDLGVNVPDEFCQNNPNVTVSRQCFGVDSDGNVTDVGAAPTIWVTRYDGGPYTTANGFTDLYNDWTSTKAATHSQTFSVMGLAWDKRSGRLISSALVRRNVALHEKDGTPRPGALFTTVPNGRTATATGGSTQFLVDLEELLPGDQFSNLTAPPAGVANAGFTGYIPTNAARGVPNGADSDILAGTDGVYEEAGKTGIGDIDADHDGNLYVVSLYDKNLYKVPLPANGSAPVTMTSIGVLDSNVTCTNGEARPYGIEIWRGAVYAGVVCDGSADYSPAAPNAVDDRNLTFSITRYDLDGGSWSMFLGPYPLHAAVSGAPFKGSPVTSDTNAVESNTWNAWTDRFSTTWERGAWPPVRPVPMLADIEFDRDGSLILGFRDRTIDQNPSGVLYPDGSPGRLTGLNAGDVMRICRTGTGYSASDYEVQGQTGCPLKWTNGTAATTDDEWYRDNYGDTGHPDTSAGMTEYVPGFPEVLNSAMDPYDGVINSFTWSAGGIRWMVNSTGGGQTAVNAGSGVIFFTGPSTPPNNLGSFNKANGMGDIEALCDEAPLQIGNRVWRDLDGDGVQDPGEPPISGVTVRLYDDAGVLVGTAVTNSDGEYYFASTTTEAAAGNGDAAGGGLVANSSFTIRLDNPADYAAGGPLENHELGDANQGTPAGSDIEDAIDSDATESPTYPSIPVPATSPGDNDHTYDVGFRASVSVGDLVWIDLDADGVQDAEDPGLAGVELALTDMAGNPVTDVYGNIVGNVTTGADGSYSFDDLPLGQYKVTVVGAPAGYAPTKAGVGTGEADSSTGSATSRDMQAAGDRDPTLDFGFRRTAVVSVGDRVWRDRNGDGYQGRVDPGVGGVRLRIFDEFGNPARDINNSLVPPQVTNRNGRYSFDNLPPGKYTVKIVYPKGFRPTTADRPNRAMNSSSYRATTVALVNGQRDATLDFGIVSAVPWRPGLARTK